jgi:hypothetical protein
MNARATEAMPLVKRIPMAVDIGCRVLPTESVVANFAMGLCFVIHIDHASGMVNDRCLSRLDACWQGRKRALGASHPWQHDVCRGVSFVEPGRSSILPQMKPARK